MTIASEIEGLVVNGHFLSDRTFIERALTLLLRAELERQTLAQRQALDQAKLNLVAATGALERAQFDAEWRAKDARETPLGR